MDRDDFLTKKRLPVRRGQKWALIEPWHANSLPQYIEIMEVNQFKEGSDKILKCKIREFSMEGKNRERIHYKRVFGALGAGTEAISQFMLAGDILTFYEQI